MKRKYKKPYNGCTMICVVIKGPTYKEAHLQIGKALKYADLVELRLDLFTTLDIAALQKLRSDFTIPMIFTLRSQEQGGGYTKSEEDRLVDIRRLVKLRPEYLDLESHLAPSFIHEIASESKLILSYHDFKATPDLEKIYQQMRKIPAFFYKIAVAASNAIDALKLLCWVKKKENNVIAISMGPYGEISRIVAPLVGIPITYASLDNDQTTAPGQLSAKVLNERYQYRSLNTKTALYGLIGDPVDLSISDDTHNYFIRTSGFNAVYVKIKVAVSEVAQFLQLARELPFKGLSVTMPLKEAILPYLDEIDPQALEIGAVNTLHFHVGKLKGYNTDGIGALNAIEKETSIKGKKIVIIGAGGAAKSIAYEAVQRGGFVTIVNRDTEKAHQLATHFHCISKGFEQIGTEEYAILINCTPLPMPVHADHIRSKTVVMDIKTKPKETPFLTVALEKGCPVIYGYKMFIGQAIGQFQIWFKDQIDIKETEKMLEHEAIRILDGCNI